MSPWLLCLLLGLLDHLWLRIEFGGDIALGRRIPERIESVGADRYFASLRNHLRFSDLVVANLEGSVHTASAAASVEKRHDLSFDAEALQHLTQSGISVFGLANNHAGDGGPGSPGHTIAALSGLGLTGFTGRYAARVKGVPLVIHAADLTASSLCDKRCLDLVKRVGHDSRSALTFVFLHAGIEDTAFISAAERILAKRLIAAGAAGIFGHHPHRTKAGGSLDGRPVYHSLGSVLFDRSRKPDCYGLLVRAHVWAGIPLTWQEFVVHMQPATHRPVVLPDGVR